MVANKIDVLSKFFREVVFKHTPRAANSIADDLEKQGIRRVSDLVAWLGWGNQLILADVEVLCRCSWLFLLSCYGTILPTCCLL